MSLLCRPSLPCPLFSDMFKPGFKKLVWLYCMSKIELPLLYLSASAGICCWPLSFKGVNLLLRRSAFLFDEKFIKLPGLAKVEANGCSC